METKFGSEAQESFVLWSENGEVWGHALEHLLSPPGHGQGCFIGILRPGWGGGEVGGGRVLAGRAQLRCSPSRRQRRAPRTTHHAPRLCTQPAAAILNCSIRAGSPGGGVTRSGSVLGTLIQRVRCRASAQAPYRRVKPHHAQKNRLDLILSPRFRLMFPGNC